MAEKNDNKVLAFLRNKIAKMNEEELQQYLKRFGLELTPEGVTEEMIQIINEHLKKVASTPVAPPRYMDFDYGMRDLSAENHWRKNIKNSSFIITRPVIICLPGNGTITDEKANGFCKLIERAVGLNHEADLEHSSYKYLDIIGVHYGTNRSDQTAGTLTAKEAEVFVEHLLMPLCVDDKGNSLSKEQICYNMTLVTFASHCYGAVALDIIMNNFDSKLIGLGFTQEDIVDIKSHIAQITYSPYLNKASVPTVAIDSMTDSFHRGLDDKYEAVYGHKLNGVELQYDKPGMFMNAPCEYQNSFEILHVFTSRLLNREDNRDLSKLIDEHTIEYLERELNWLITEKAQNAKNADAVSLALSYSIAWFVSKSINAYYDKQARKRNNLDEELMGLLVDVINTYSQEELEM